MPRIVYDEPAQINPGMAAADLATGLFGGLLQGQMAEQQRARSQEEAAFGNPYERRRRALTWQTLPENVRSAPNSALYQQLIMSGADPMSVLKAHQELDTDPVYGDTKTQKARGADLEAARKGGLITEDDVAGQEAIRRGELTLGQLIKNRESAKLSKQEKDDAAAALSKQWRDYLEGEYKAAVTKAEYENVNEQVKREGKAALLPDDLAAVYAAAAACKKKADENELIAATPLGG